MTNANKAKGTKWESAIREFFRSIDIRAYRPAQTGRLDVGDIHGIEPFIGQAKNWNDIPAALREGVEGAEAQAAHAGADYGVAFIKRARAGTDRGYAAMSIATFGRVLARLRAAETALAYANPATYAGHMTAVRKELSE